MTKYEYYIDYYKNVYSRKDFESAAQNKVKEMDQETRRLQVIGKFLKLDYSTVNKVLIVGCGTGGLAEALHNLGAKSIDGIDPDYIAIEIANRDSPKPNISFVVGVAEDLPYQTDSFDLVLMISVLEHVHDVRKSLCEIHRVCKPGGYVYLDIPDYRFPYEPHFKTFAPVFFGKQITKLYMMLRGKNYKSVSDLNFITKTSVIRQLLDLDIVDFSLHYHRKNTSRNRFGNSVMDKLSNYFINKNITPTLCLEIRK
jgi:ubiquinone/menaquinone biosynthesis C-methylase UbiE